MLRTHKCDELNGKNIDEEVTLCWWVSNRRDHGWIIFIDLRDRYGLTQVVFDPEDDAQSHKTADGFRSEYVIKATGKVRSRPEGQANPNMKTGEIEIIVSNVEILSTSKTPPFELDDHGDLANEEVRYKHRYIDLRRPAALDNVIFRSKFLQYTRNWFSDRDFLEVTTPIFTASSPEWARDFVIPSRLNPGKFYALPQAPQQYKQLLMVWGIDKYFQVAPCFRDEDPRADRHSCEFYQIDCEMSFVEQEDVFSVVENFITDIVWSLTTKEINGWGFQSMTFEQAIENYGTDKPDLRYDMLLVDVLDIFANSTNEIFSSIASDPINNRIKAIKVTGWDEKFSKTQMKGFEDYVRKFWAKGLWYFQMKEDGLKGPLNKFFSEGDLAEIVKRTDLQTGDVVFFWAGERDIVCDYMGKFRVYLAEKLELQNPDVLAFSWITDFPMFEINEITGKVDFGHNPFSMPKGWIGAFEEDDLLKVQSVQYDLACNGYEMLSGSIRNHDVKALIAAFEKVGRTEAEVKEKFGAMHEAFQYWAPPHGWFWFWVDRFIMVLKDEPNIREIYAFPKSWKAQDAMMNAPTELEDAQLQELSIKVEIEEE